MKRFILFILALSVFSAIAQQAPTGNAPANTTTAQAVAAWYRGGNNNGNGSNNIFGTRWNSGIYTMTDNQYRMQLNGTASYPVNGLAGNRDGYLLLGKKMLNNYNGNNGAYSLLHLNGSNTAINQMPSLGYRTWMQAGVTFTDNADLGYVGIRKIGSTIDISEFTVAWSNDGPGSSGPDDMAFRFLNGGGNSLSTNLNLDTL